jgi:glycosyltransferase involved in cell wall biosynthesis
VKKLKLLFDAGPMLDRQKTGVGYYVASLVNSLQTHHSGQLEMSGYYFNFLHRNPRKAPPDSRINFKEIRFVPGKLLSLCRRLHFQPYLEVFIRQKSDFVLFTNYVALPLLAHQKMALVIYDVSFLDVPEYTQQVNLTYLQRFCPPSIKRADLIITISEFTKERIAHHFPELKAQIVVTHIPPIDMPITTTDLTERLIRLGISSKRYILHVGTVEPRKNLEGLLDAYQKLDPKLRDTYALVLAGGRGWKDEAIMKRVADYQSQQLNVILTGYTSEIEKSALYSNAACFVMASHYEGFGMPILEAMQHAIPTAVSDISVFHEVSGEASVYFNKDDPHDIAQKLSYLLTDTVYAAKLVNLGHEHLQSFSWQENAEKVFEALEDHVK